MRANRGTVIGGLFVSLAFLTAGCGASPGASPTSTPKGSLTVAAFNLSESAILAQIYGQALKAKGYTITFKLNLGSREVIEPALEKGDIALDGGSIDIGLVLSSDSPYSTGKYVQLQDDKHLQNADNAVPIIRKDKANSEVTNVLDAVDAKLTTDTLIALNKKADVDKQDPDVIASDWLKSNGFTS